MKTIDITVKKNEEKVVPFVWICSDVLIQGNTVVKGEREFFVDAQLIGEGATLTILAIFLGNKHDSVVFNTNVVHKAPRTKSLTSIRGVFFNNAEFRNDGMVRINRGAKGADGYFASKVLLFDDAKGRSVPSLEIDENDLKAGHASTVGRPNPEEIFYLRSRGLTEEAAERLIVTGFFDPILASLPKEARKITEKKIAHVLKKQALS